MQEHILNKAEYYFCGRLLLLHLELLMSSPVDIFIVYSIHKETLA